MRQALSLSVACMVLLLASPTLSTSQETAGGTTKGYPTAVLSKPFTPMLGDMIALSVGELVTALKQYADAPTIAVYDRDANKIALIMYGGRSTLDGAKSSMDDARKLMQARIPIIGNLYHVTLAEANFAYVYYHDEKVLVRWEDGKYTVAGE
jgi:hypothetical protein